jgi:multisubunit Na+/H+ antiporter MnhB subunit
VSVLWIIVICLVAIVALLTLFDIIRSRYSLWKTVGWAVLVVVLPLIGSIIYWALRKPSQKDVEQQYAAQSELRRTGTLGR